METSNNKLKSILEYLIKFAGIISISVYYFGFLFTQGLTAAFDPTGNPYSWFSKGFLGFTPFSHQLYFLNGIFFLINVILFISITYFLWRYPFCIIIIFLKLLNDNTLVIFYKFLNDKVKEHFPKFHKSLKNKIKVSFSTIIHRTYCEFLCPLIPAIIILIFMLILSKILINNNDNQLYFLKILYIIIFFNSTFELIRVDSHLALSNTITENNPYNIIKNVKNKIICFLVIILYLTLFSYTYGIVSICQYMSDVQDKKDSLKAAIISTTDNHQNTYFYLDNNTDFFIGYTPNPNSLVMIPKSSIKNIHVYALNVSDDKEKYIKTNDNKYSIFSKDLVKIINNYYLYRIEKPYPNEYLNLLSHDYLKENLSNISPDILGKLWEKNKTYNDKNINDFIGIDLSLPEYDKNLSTKKDSIYSIYVIEYWKNDKEFIKYSFKSSNGIWKINSINSSYQPFKFK